MDKSSQCTAVALVAFLAACAVVEKPDDPELDCRDRRHVTVSHARGYLAVYPEEVKVCRNTTVVLNFVPRVRARTEPGDERQPEWLRASGEGRSLEIVVPPGAEYRTYKYNVIVEGVGSLDPRITVSR